MLLLSDMMLFVCFVLWLVMLYVGFCLIVLGIFIGYRCCGFLFEVLCLWVYCWLFVLVWLLFRVVVVLGDCAVCNVGFRAKLWVDSACLFVYSVLVALSGLVCLVV